MRRRRLTKVEQSIFYERLLLIRNSSRSAEQESRLRELDAIVEALPVGRSGNPTEFAKLMVGFVKDFPDYDKDDSA